MTTPRFSRPARRTVIPAPRPETYVRAEGVKTVLDTLTLNACVYGAETFTSPSSSPKLSPPAPDATDAAISAMRFAREAREQDWQQDREGLALVALCTLLIIALMVMMWGLFPLPALPGGSI